MLRHLPQLESLQQELRKNICAHCSRRPRHSEGLGPEVVRPCEIDCSVFTHLPALEHTAISIDPMLRSRRDAVQHRIAEFCRQDRLAKAHGNNPRWFAAARRTPLGRYRQQVVDTVLHLVGEN